jgi:enterochelin esterase family protein
MMSIAIFQIRGSVAGYDSDVNRLFLGQNLHIFVKECTFDSNILLQNLKQFSMKKLFLLVAAACFAFSASAQEALGSRAQVVSPQINENNSVTLRLAAPEAKKVTVAGNFLTPDGTPVENTEMVRNADGVWEYTSPVLRSELYNYNFVVDGVRICDPSNVFICRDVASSFNIFIIGGDRGDIYSVNDVPHGSVTKTWYDSPTLQTKRRVTVYTPAGYEKSNAEYPVLYLLHGAGGDEEAWIALGRTSQILDNLIAQGKCEPMIVVMTNGNAWQQAAPGESAAGMTSPSMGGGGRRGGNAGPQKSFEDSFGDVIKYVEANYRVIKKKEGRAVAGLSMGGMHSANISRMYAKTFDYVGLFSAALPNTNDEAIQAGIKAQKDNGFKLYWIACGTTDFLYQANLGYMKYLDSIDFPYTYRESDGGHIWRNWRLYLSEFAPMLWK